MARMLLQTIEQIGREKNIASDVIVDAVEEAMAVASKKYYKTEEELEARLNRETGEVDVYAIKIVVVEVADPDLEISEQEAQQYDSDVGVGDMVRLPRSTEELGRIAAQAAKQVIFQKVRDAERENIFNEFTERTGELLTGIVKRFERGDMIVDLGRAEGLLPRREQSRAEHYNIGDRIRVVIMDVLKVSRGPQIVVSRVSPELLIRLFEMEVPEIYDGTVVIKGAVREGGDRAKVAVHSVEADVDPVGACVGMRGSRVQSIIRELKGEKIDIVQWSSDMQQYAINSLKPARVNRVGVMEDEQPHLEVIVDEDQLSLAIGKRGQNVRLAGKLLNCKIDIKSEEDKRRDVEKTLARMARREAQLETLPGVGPRMAQVLDEACIKSVGDVVEASIEGLMAVPGIGTKTAEKIFTAAVDAVEGPEEPDEEQQVTDNFGEAIGVGGDAAAVLASMEAESIDADAEQPSESDVRVEAEPVRKPELA
ncbi:MAG: transcription termination factor NusA [Acidobacteriota bacterium]